MPSGPFETTTWTACASDALDLRAPHEGLRPNSRVPNPGQQKASAKPTVEVRSGEMIAPIADEIFLALVRRLNVYNVGMNARELRRRQFLKAGGTAAGTLIVGGAGVWVASSPRIELPEASYPGTKDTGNRVLVAYASKAGSTAEVAGAIGKRLAHAGLAVDVRRARNVRSVDGYAAVIVGSAIRAGQWLSEASGFVKTQKEALAARKTAYFTLCMTLRQDTPEHREKVAAY